MSVEGRIEDDAIRQSAGSAGIFNLILDGELFWGREHLAHIRERLTPLANSNSVYSARDTDLRLKMKAIRVHEFGGPEVLKLEDTPTPKPSAG